MHLGEQLFVPSDVGLHAPSALDATLDIGGKRLLEAR
jgi:hypothetical protein